MALAGMLAEITQQVVRGLLEQRRPDILVSIDPEQAARFEARVRGAAVEVVLLTGSDPAVGPIRALAVEAIALQTGSEIEYAEYPEQQAPGDAGRGYHLHQRYLELLARLQKIIDAIGGIPDDGGQAPIVTTPIPRGRFPEGLPYPDPVDVPYRRRFT